MSLYDDLGISPDATADEITAAYRQVAKLHHPDQGGDAEAFRRICRAAEVLRDPDRRDEYDRTGRTGDEPPDMVEIEAGQALSLAFQQALQVAQAGPIDIARLDVMAGTVAQLEQNRANLASNRATALKEQCQVARAASRISKTGAGADVLGDMLDAQLTAIEERLVQMDHIDRVLERALEIAAEYRWEMDVVTQPFYLQGFTIAQPATARLW